MSARPLVSVFNQDGVTTSGSVTLPVVLTTPIRPDLVHFVHTNVSKNSRQPYSVSRRAGHQTSAISWGTGRAVSRIPRVSGGGTSRSGQGAFGNMCRGGRMFNPTKTWRRWNRKVNVNQKRYAVASALAASAVPSLVFARGHKIDNVPEFPLVVNDSVEGLKKTKQAVDILKKLGAEKEIEAVVDSKALRAGRGKGRNRRFTQKLGPLVIYNSADGIEKAFRNIPGVELAQVDALNILSLAPGGHLGRFVIWTESAIKKLDSIYGTYESKTSNKADYTLPRHIISNADIARIINSDEVQSKLRPKIVGRKRLLRKKNPLKNLGVMLKLNPYTSVTRRRAVKAQLKSKADREARVNAARNGEKLPKAALTLKNIERRKFKKIGKKFSNQARVDGEVKL